MAAEAKTATTWPTVADVAQRLGVSPSRIRQLVLDDTLKTERVGPLHLIDPTSLASYEQHRDTLPRDVRGRVVETRGRRRKEAPVAD